MRPDRSFLIFSDILKDGPPCLVHLLKPIFKFLTLFAPLVDHVSVWLPDFIRGGARATLSPGCSPFVSKHKEINT